MVYNTFSILKEKFFSPNMDKGGSGKRNRSSKKKDPGSVDVLDSVPSAQTTSNSVTSTIALTDQSNLNHYQTRNPNTTLVGDYFTSIGGRLNNPEFSTEAGKQLLNTQANFASNDLVVNVKAKKLPATPMLQRVSPLLADQAFFRDFKFSTSTIKKQREYTNKRLKYPRLVTQLFGLAIDSAPKTALFNVFGEPSKKDDDQNYANATIAAYGEEVAEGEETKRQSPLVFLKNTAKREFSYVADTTVNVTNRHSPDADNFKLLSSLRNDNFWLHGNEYNVSPVHSAMNDLNFYNQMLCVIKAADDNLMSSINDKNSDIKLEATMNGWFNNVPYMQSFLGDIVKVGTLLYIMCDALSMAYSNMNNLYSVTGIIPFAHKYLNFRSTNSFKPIEGALLNLKYYSDKFPVDNKVIEKWNSIKSVSKLHNGDIHDEDNAILAPYISLIFSEHPDDEKTELNKSGMFYSVKTRQNLSETSVDMPAQSLYTQLVKRLAVIPVNDGGARGSSSNSVVTISANEITDFMHGFLWQFSPTTRGYDSGGVDLYLPELLDRYLMQFNVPLGFLKNSGILNNTIFTYLPPVDINVTVDSSITDVNINKWAFRSSILNHIVLSDEVLNSWTADNINLGAIAQEFRSIYVRAGSDDLLFRDRIIKLFETHTEKEDPNAPTDETQTETLAVLQQSVAAMQKIELKEIQTVLPIYYDTTLRNVFDNSTTTTPTVGTFGQSIGGEQIFAGKWGNSYYLISPTGYYYTSSHDVNAGPTNLDAIKLVNKNWVMNIWDLTGAIDNSGTSKLSKLCSQNLIQAESFPTMLYRAYIAYLAYYTDSPNFSFYRYTNPEEINDADVQDIPLAMGWDAWVHTVTDDYGIIVDPNRSIRFSNYETYLLPDPSVYKAFITTNPSTIRLPNRHVITMDDLDSEAKFEA